MSKNIISIIIHTHKPLARDTFTTISQRLGDVEGVVKFEQHPSNPKLIMVAYHVGRIRALSILNKLSGHGVDASLVGI